MKIAVYVLFAVLATACAEHPDTARLATSPPAGAAPAAASTRAVVDVATQREERATEIVDHLAAKDFSGARRWFDATMREHLAPEQLESVWTQVLANNGAFTSRTVRGKRTIEGHPVVEIDLAFERGHGVARVVFDDDAQIAGLFLQPQ
jgi:hypothetical protein